MQVKERLIKEIRNLPPDDVVNVYELVLDLKRKRRLPPSMGSRAYIEVQKILEKCGGRMSDDIKAIREDKI